MRFSLTTNKQKKTINTAFISSHVCLKNRVSDYWNVHLFYFYKQIFSGMRNYCHHEWKIGYNFEMKRRIKIHRHGTMSSKCLHNSSKFSYREKMKNRIWTVMRLATPRRQANKVLIDKRKYQFSWTIVFWQVTDKFSRQWETVLLRKAASKTGPTISSLRLVHAESIDWLLK